ncbi:unnamed protein product [Schistocephalus solidus]|uniref:DUF4328 domain-containing protein n=1 Tax=Schistocephalus solidus TaxID=70667 RepID=A0A183T6T5_SCHSO|nr:unnamed protein product [Schistocephalus solidus]
MDGIERGNKVNKEDSRRFWNLWWNSKIPLSVGIWSAYACLTPNPAWLGSVLESNSARNGAEDNSEDLRINVNESYAPVILASRLISLLVNRYKDA